MVKTVKVSHLRQIVSSLILWLFLVPVFSSCITHEKLSQRSDVLLVKAQNLLSAGNYIGAESLVKKAIKIDSTNVKAYLLLSDISDELSNLVQQKGALMKVVELDSVNYPLAYKILANLCFSNGNYREAQENYEYYKQFKIVADTAFVSERIISSVFAQTSISQNRNVLIIRPGETINTGLNEYWPAIATNDSLLYFTRLIKNDNNFPYERIFISARGVSGWDEASELVISSDEFINTGTMCISADNKLLFFTACGQKQGYGSCDIYYSRKINNSWSSPVNAGPILNTSAWEAQPSISSDNQFLYFSSNRAGGYGQMDIWRCKMNEMKDGSLFFSDPVNMGKRINTREDDFSPFIHADGTTLYFSSKGKYGMGGSDIFISRMKDSTWSEAVNLGYPINTRFNDDGLVVSPTSSVAFFSSDREGTLGGSKDLFQLEIPQEFLPEKVGYIAGMVYDIELGKSVSAKIDITQLESGHTKKIESGIDDGYITTLTAGKLYALHVDKEGYLFYSRHFNLTNVAGINKAEHVDIFLEPVKVGKKITLSNVFFDFASDVLKPESDEELIHLTDFLRSNPRIEIEISGHTDSIGNSAYNIELSEKRAKAIYDYLIRFVNPQRLTYKGYGAQMPVATNDTEEGRALNRRSEIKIIGE